MRKWLALPPDRWSILLQTTILLGLVQIGLKVRSFNRMRRFVDWAAGTLPGPHPAAPQDMERIAWALAAAGRRLPGFGNGPCLAQALTGQWLLRRRGIPADLCIGVRRGPAGELLAHAWVEIGGQVVIGGPQEAISGYTRLLAVDGELL